MHDKHSIRSHVISVLNSPTNNPANSHHANQIIRTLSKNNNIVITRSDKGSRTVIMNTMDYISGMNRILSNSDVFTPATAEDQTVSNSKYKKDLRTLCRNKIITTDELQGFLSNLHGQAYIYGLPKVHKINIPLRPIVAFHLSPTAPLAQYLAKIIIPLFKEGAASTSISSTPKFLDHIQQLPVVPNSLMISFDVINLYPSLPHSLILECTTEFLRTHGQSKGTPMGSPLSSPLSEIVMRKVDCLITGHFQADIHTRFRYIDDIFCIVKTESLDSIHTKLNSLFPDIQFTVEIENNCSLAFLDIMITKQNCSATETYELNKEAFGDAALSRSRTFEWFSRFPKGREKVKDDQHAERPRSLRCEENKLKIKELIKSNRIISIKDLSSETGLSIGLCHQIVTKDLDMIRTSSEFALRILTEEQKEVRMDVCKNMVEMTRTYPEWMQKIITGDETWVYQYDPETKRQSSQ
ncbi:hypothetical protein LAZ67_12001008 [Cordylochernes scorpioides]|uniref:Reverse transcriptase domain-containing protein n=1 Tax=Cordylochernes scorpioides TaxID=51811 RepID=A0ABY6L1R7_9ARAC|nr:hypothetical protein LAZ67_12001008 [Cordylochernes scorpioides]